MNKIPVLHYMYMAGFVNDDGKWDSRPISQQEDNFKTFAELIVKECVSLFDGSEEMKTVGLLSHKQIVDKIEEHFRS